MNMPDDEARLSIKCSSTEVILSDDCLITTMSVLCGWYIQKVSAFV